jgi:hypothetical protein
VKIWEEGVDFSCLTGSVRQEHEGACLMEVASWRWPMVVLAPLMEVVMKINSVKASLTCENISCNWAALTVIGF